MKFAIPFSKNFKYFNQQQTQINIKYKPNIKALYDFVKEYQSYRINFILPIDSSIDDVISKYKALKETLPNSNIVICFPLYNENIQNRFIQQQIPHYYKEFVTSYEKFQGFLKLAVTDIFVAEQLAFSVQFISKITKEKGIQIRSFCNVCQKGFPTTPSLKGFFIRPQDMDLYAQFIDVFQFYFSEQTTFQFNLNTLYEIFAIDKKWKGKLKQIILSYDGQENNNFILPDFGAYRLRCRRKCFSQGSSVCKICDQIVDLSYILKEKNLIIEKI